MLVQLIRASRSRSALAALSRASSVHTVQLRGFIAPTVSRKADYVQELYLKELKAYKTPPVKDSDADGQVQMFQEPKTPQSPEESDLASSLKEYESMVVEIEGQEGSGEGSAHGATAVPDWLEAEEDEKPQH